MLTYLHDSLWRRERNWLVARNKALIRTLAACSRTRPRSPDYKLVRSGGSRLEANSARWALVAGGIQNATRNRFSSPNAGATRLFKFLVLVKGIIYSNIQRIRTAWKGVIVETLTQRTRTFRKDRFPLENRFSTGQKFSAARSNRPSSRNNGCTLQISARPWRPLRLVNIGGQISRD